jgi:predicted RecB family nuclease
MAEEVIQGGWRGQSCTFHHHCLAQLDPQLLLLAGVGLMQQVQLHWAA